MDGERSTRVALEFSSDDFAVADALRFLAAMRKTGCAFFEWRSGAARIFLRDGRLGAGGVQPDDVHSALLEAGLVEEAEPGDATEPLVDGLLASGDENVHTFLEQRRADALCAVLATESVRLRFLVDVHEPFPHLGDVAVDESIDAVGTRVAQLREANATLGDRSRALALVVAVPHDEIRLTPVAWELLAGSGAHVPIDALARAHPGGEVAAVAGVLDLVRRGLATTTECGPTLAAVPEVDAEVNGGDQAAAHHIDTDPETGRDVESEHDRIRLDTGVGPAIGSDVDLELDIVPLSADEPELWAAAGLDLSDFAPAEEDALVLAPDHDEFVAQLTPPPIPDSSWPPLSGPVEQDHPTLPEVPAIYFPTAQAEDPAQAERNRLVADLRSLLGG